MGLAGGCMCGAVRYELLSDPFDCGWCHCRGRDLLEVIVQLDRADMRPSQRAKASSLLRIHAGHWKAGSSPCTIADS